MHSTKRKKKSKEVLGLLDGEDTEVILEVKEDPQIRVKDVSEIDRKDLADGWFKLKNLVAERFLTATSSTILTISGKKSILPKN